MLSSAAYQCFQIILVSVAEALVVVCLPLRAVVGLPVYEILVKSSLDAGAVAVFFFVILTRPHLSLQKDHHCHHPL